MTAEEFFNAWDEISEDEFDYKLCMIEFAKYHVQLALKECCYEIDKQSILTAYPLENIK